MNERDRMMERVAAARSMIDRTGMPAQRQEDAELAAFMSIFHPEYDRTQVADMLRERRAERGSR